jgi:hypothetical protein
MDRLRAQGHNIHAIPRPVSHPRIPGNGNKTKVVFPLDTLTLK